MFVWIIYVNMDLNLNNFSLGTERPSGNPTCSVQSVNVNADLQYHCQWLGGTPLAQLSFPALSSTSSGAGNFSMTVPASDTFNGKTVKCMAVHPVEQNQCNITASKFQMFYRVIRRGFASDLKETNWNLCKASSPPGSPAEFLPAVRTTVNSEGKIVVAIHCVSEAAPQAVVSWSKGSEAVTNGTTYQISNDTTHLKIHGYNVSNFLQQKYTCTCRNPLGSQRLEIQLRGIEFLLLFWIYTRYCC